MPRSPSRRKPTPIRARIAAAVVIAVVIAAVAVVVVVASGSENRTSTRHGLLESMFQDDQYTLYQPTAADVANTLNTLKSLGVDRVRVQVLWYALAPHELSRTTPHGFDATNPADYSAAAWAPYDRLLRLAAARGMGVNFDVTAPGPLWAMRRPSPDPAVALDYAPSVKAWRQFVTAVGRRYSGSYTPAGTHSGPLPRVAYWSIWNEPNQPGWLSPQSQTRNRRQVPDSPRMYRQYADAAWQALAATGHRTATDTILVGETAPEGCLNRGAGCRYPPDEEPIPPMQFVESLYCVTASFHRLTGSLAAAEGCPSGGSPSAFVRANPVLFDATGYAHHPYSLLLAPNLKFRDDPGFVSIANLSELEHGLDRIYSSYGVHRQIPIYLTEYGYETHPPNPYRGVPPQLQSEFLNEAEYLASRDPRVRSLSQFLLVDSAPDKAAGPPGSSAYWSTFQTGLEYLNRVKKPSYYSYRLPVWIAHPSFASGGSVAVWAMLRPAPNGSEQHAELQWSPPRGSWRTLSTVATDDLSNVLTARVSPPGTGEIRVAWSAPGGGAFYSRSVRVARR